MLKLTFVLALVALGAQFSIVKADSNAGGPANVGVGQKEVTKNLIWLGPARKKDRAFVLRDYSIKASPPNVLSYTFVVTHLDGTTETIPAEEGQHNNFNHLFSGALDIKLARKGDDTSYPVSVYISRHIRAEGESNFP